MEEWNRKTVFLYGEEAYRKLETSHVAIVGIGGVGAFAAEYLCRAGIGHLSLMDGDTVSESNLNRQLPALRSTQGKSKVEVMAKRLLDINPKLDMHPIHRFLEEKDVESFLNQPFDLIVDAFDTVGPKVALLEACVRRGIPVISAMGAAGKTDPSQICQCDISKTHTCALAKKVRHELSLKGIKHGVPVVFSPESPHTEYVRLEKGERSVPGTVSYMPAAFACHLAAYAIAHLLNS